MTRLRTGAWNLSELKDVPKNGRNVFTIFHCGGGSSMGYKLAGYDVVGGVEIDKQMMQIYRLNHQPKHSYLMGVQEFNEKPVESLPPVLRNLDILDGSPPCSTFSSAGLREKAWGKLKMFREGQAMQVLDDLFGHFLITVSNLRPKVVVAENVKGMLLGPAKGYVREICQTFGKLGYSVQVFLLNARQMGVPQRRQRVFFVANRLGKKINLNFTEADISLHQAIHDVAPQNPKMIKSALLMKNWTNANHNGFFGNSRNEGMPTNRRSNPSLPTYTMNATKTLYHWSQPRLLQGLEINRVQTFPDDYNFDGLDNCYVCGMSVPPFMMQRVADQIHKQLFAGLSSGQAGD